MIMKFCELAIGDSFKEVPDNNGYAYIFVLIKIPTEIINRDEVNAQVGSAKFYL